MQVNSISSTSFGNKQGIISYDPSNDVEQIRQISRALKEFNNDQIKVNGDEAKPKIKSPIKAAASILLGAGAVFAAAKKGFNGVSSIVTELSKKTSAQKLGNTVNGFVNTLKGSKFAKALARTKVGEFAKEAGGKLGDFIKNKVGVSNAVAGLVTAGATTHILRQDNNNDDIPDIIQDKVNAYDGLIKGAIKVVNTFS